MESFFMEFFYGKRIRIKLKLIFIILNLTDYSFFKIITATTIFDHVCLCVCINVMMTVIEGIRVRN